MTWYWVSPYPLKDGYACCSDAVPWGNLRELVQNDRIRMDITRSYQKGSSRLFVSNTLATVSSHELSGYKGLSWYIKNSPPGSQVGILYPDPALQIDNTPVELIPGHMRARPAKGKKST